MHDTRNRCASTVVDVRHRTGDGASGRNTAEERDHHVGDALADQLRVGVVLVARHTIRHHGGEQRLDSAQHSDRERGREQPTDNAQISLVRRERHVRHVRHRNTRRQLVQIADGLDGSHPAELAQEINSHCHHHDSHQRTRHLLRDLRSEDDDEQAQQTHTQRPEINMAEVLEITNPFMYEVSRHILDAQAEQIVHLRGEDRQRDTARETHDHRVRDELDDATQVEETHENQQDTRHDRGDSQTTQAILLDDAIDDHDERTRRSTDLHLRSAEKRDQETRDNRSEQTLCRTHARSDSECDG